MIFKQVSKKNHKLFIIFLTISLAFLFVNTSCVSNFPKVDFSKQNSFALNKTDTIRILAIGNSFSADALDNYFYALARAVDQPVIIGNMYIGGCSLEAHLDNIKNNNPNYWYYKTNGIGERTVTDKYTLAEALADENWDIITMQQASPFSGEYETYEASLPELFALVKQQATNPNVKYALHQTWAYQSDFKNSNFERYDNDQQKMFENIVYASNKAADSNGIDIVIPSGTAIQNGRTSEIGDNFCRDGYHLNLDYGRFTAALTWLEKLFDIDATTVQFTPQNISEKQAKIAKEAVHSAIINPKAITVIQVD